MGTHVGRRVLHKLSDRQIRALHKPGYYGDGGGLYLQVSRAGTQSWVFRFTLDHKAHEMGLGSVTARPLAQARRKAQEAREMLADGRNPLHEKKARLRADAPTRVYSFEDAASDFVKMRSPEWSNPKHIDQWVNTLETYAFPILGKLDVGDISTQDVKRVLDPIWSDKTETAVRLRGRIESIISYADKIANRDRLNPARWKGHLDALLPKPSKVAEKGHHAALPYKEMGAFLADLKAQPGMGALLVEFIALTAVRTGEAVGARWEEFDLKAKTWVIPKSRMKAKIEHRVPLSDAAVKIIKRMAEVRKGEFVFPGRADKPMSNMGGLALLRRMGRTDITVHGFRSSFRDWAREQTSFPREVAEAALAHTLQDKTEAAYARGDMLEKRRKLMEAWAGYCARVNEGATVTPIRARKA